MESKQKQLKRSNESLFGGLFSAGATWAAIFAPVIIITFFIIAFGDVATRSYILKLMTTFGGKLFLFFMISFPIWCGLHRILHTLHDINIHPKRGNVLTYGLALAWTLHAGYILFIH
ncbi:fumarate reductase subunit FrdD [Orbus sturtevantii]|uniref:fumarate reductase subunit FrdD n=1 Tax=Orbus sturtevantii TaxID=3074109 RepID=UPI00370D5119